MLTKHRILFIGAGRMAEAIFSGLLKTSKEYIEEIIVSNRSNVEKLKQLRARYNVSTATDWKQHVTSVDTIVLAMPPSAHEELLAELSPLLSNQLVVTGSRWHWPILFRRKTSHWDTCCLDYAKYSC